LNAAVHGDVRIVNQAKGAAAMREGGLENLDRPRGTEDEAAGGVPEDLQPAAGSQRSEQSARGVLAELESCLATHDLDQMVGFFTEDAVLLGDAEEAFGGDAVRAYLRVMADMEPTVRWQWDRVVVVLDAPGVLSFAAVGSIVFNDPAGQPLGEEAPFRVTCLAVQEQNVWRLRHFHGSRPQ
jgi:uncharacterized protein (TIGR02246 family)